MRVTEESEKSGLKLSIEKTKIMTYGHDQKQANRSEESGSNDKFYILGLQNHWRW